METKVAVVAVVVEDRDSVERLNEILHDYADYIIGRMGIPYRAKKINIISVVVDAPHDVISALSGRQSGRSPNMPWRSSGRGSEAPLRGRTSKRDAPRSSGGNWAICSGGRSKR